MGNISPVVLRKEIGRRLRVARNEAGLNLVEAAKRLEIAGSSLSRFENGSGPVTVHLVRSMMDVYDQRLDDVLDLIRQARTRGWWKQYGISDKDFVALETGAARISTYELSFVPGLAANRRLRAGPLPVKQQRPLADGSQTSSRCA